MKTLLRKYICHWAFLKEEDFGDSDSLKALRIDFGMCSKWGMITDAIFPDRIDAYDDDVIPLDTVNDFMAFFKKHGITKLNEFKT